MRWHLLSSPDSIINGKRFIQALIAIWAIGKVVPHLALETEWSVLWTSHALQCLHTALRANKTTLMSRSHPRWIYTSTLTSTELIRLRASALSHLRTGSLSWHFLSHPSATAVSIPLISFLHSARLFRVGSINLSCRSLIAWNCFQQRMHRDCLTQQQMCVDKCSHIQILADTDKPIIIFMFDKLLYILYRWP